MRVGTRWRDVLAFRLVDVDEPPSAHAHPLFTGLGPVGAVNGDRTMRLVPLTRNRIGGNQLDRVRHGLGHTHPS
ncbi:hypothetical protein MTE01_16510 [Microbacterium testaceum]|uniref:Uncharacterized protein n=1 Tax=Microbacterium testaceum TaxID=2033 RepID=A0A4Y3QJX3_MICTE|nr:hypothetical protein MTE01_16510 [Microbacterium testaceum]